MSKKDILITWPKTRSLGSYLEELDRAKKLHLLINYRVANPPWRKTPPPPGARCFVVHDSYVRGFNYILEVDQFGDHEVSRVENDAFAGFWPAGWYIVRYPIWYDTTLVPYKGFQGWRWYTHRETP